MPEFELLLEALARELDASGISLSGWLLGAARVLPSVVLIPALGLGALPPVARVVAALALAASTAPALGVVDVPDAPWITTLLSQIAVGLPLAVGAAGTLWAASMAGNTIDQLTAQRHPRRAFDMADTAVSPLGVLLSLGAAIAFFSLGGPARIVGALAAAPEPSAPAVREVVVGLVQGIRVAVLLAAPLLVLVAFFELLAGLWARIASPLDVMRGLGPARSVLIVAIVALLLDRIFEALALWMTAQMPGG